MTGKLTHAKRLREIARQLSRVDMPGFSRDLRDIATALEAAPETAALEAKLAEWEKLGADALAEMQVSTSARAYKLRARLTALLAKPDPLLIEARELVAARYDAKTCGSAIEATLRGDDDDTAPIQNCITALKRGIELGSAK